MQKILTLIFFVPVLFYNVFAASGSIELDEFSFNKIINKFEASLIKFDVAFPYGDKHDAFVALAKESKDVNNLLFAEVGVKDYGEKDNEALAKKYGASKDNFPVIKLFIKGQKEPIPFDDSKGVTSDLLRRFVRDKSGLFLSLPGCVNELDLLAIQFKKADFDNRQLVLKEATNVLQKLAKKDEVSGKIYKTIMEKILEKGDEFIKTETDRVKKLINSKVSDEKKKELGIRLNILQSFQFVDKQNDVNDEL